MIALFACRQDKPVTMFSAVAPDHSGITFSNQLTESPSQSIATYEYFYKGAGVAAGDQDADGQTTLRNQNHYFC
jgi:hypothetical protein